MGFEVLLMSQFGYQVGYECECYSMLRTAVMCKWLDVQLLEYYAAIRGQMIGDEPEVCPKQVCRRVFEQETIHLSVMECCDTEGWHSIAYSHRVC